MSSEVTTKLELDAVKDAFTRLIAARDMATDATEQIKSDMDMARMFQETHTCDDSEYQDIQAYVKQQYNQLPPSTIISGTVGAYLFSCLQASAVIDAICTPDCANGFHDCDATACDLASYHKINGKIVKLNAVATEDANVFLANGEGITREDREILRRDGVKVITTYTQDGNTINYILGESNDITQPDPEPQPNPTPSTSGWAWLWIILGIIAIIIIIAGILSALRR